MFLEPVFFRRIAYASLALLLLLGTLTVSSGPEQEFAGEDPVILISEETLEPPMGVDQERDRNVVLVDLATYQY